VSPFGLVTSNRKLKLKLILWLLLTGLITVTSLPIDDTALTCVADELLPGLIHITAWRRNTSSRIAGTTFVYAVHGRSARVCAWPLDLLLDSNEQLTEVSPSIDDDIMNEYCLPSGGITAGLCGKIVLLSPR